MLYESRIPGVVQGTREGPGEPRALVELADEQQPALARELPSRLLDDERVSVILVGEQVVDG